MNRKLRIVNPLLINPFFGYSLFWGLIILIYFISPSKLNSEIDSRLLLFLLCTIAISSILALNFNKKYKNKEFKIYGNKPSLITVLILIFSFLAEFIYSRQIPLFETFFGVSSAYKNFGIPTLHVLIVTFSIFYCLYNFFVFINFKKKSNAVVVILIFAFFFLIFSRGLLIFCGVCCGILYLINKKIKIRHVIVLFFLALLLGWVFGIMGNIRSGCAWNDTSYLLSIAQIDANPKGILSPLFWVEEYLVCSLRNLNHNLSFANDKCLEGFVYSIVPDFIAKRILNEGNKVQLIVSAFTTSTMYAQTFVNFGFVGMAISFALNVILVKLIMTILMPDFLCKILCYTILFFLFSMSIFDNMVVYSGYAFSIIFAFIYGIRKKLRVCKSVSTL